ncbi:heterotrimeric GTP-binding alpha subunit [Coprinopsis sp. MPI-PUGE-AT-0042]|nr:heterotrimeric GTP-binding alpha subunit [Coprinopsis sp. MPI-PUGE-AT-0042]
MNQSSEKLAPGPGLVPNPYHSKTWTGAHPDETAEEALIRTRNLQEAQRISKEIDNSLLETKRAIDRRKKGTKILLLGQSESGKSSILKNFQRAFAPKKLESERLLWRAIIQLNIISSLHLVLDTLKEEWDPTPETPSSPSTPPGDSPSSSQAKRLRRLRLTLSPLFFVESNLLKTISHCTDPTCRDVCVNGLEWKTRLSHKLRLPGDGSSSPQHRSHTSPSHENDSTNVLHAQKDEILALWRDPVVQDVLYRRGVYIEQLPGFFMNDLERIATPNYRPTDGDIVRARVRTVGVEEHHFVIERGPDAHSDVYITDVGGSRSQRASWVPYFEDVQAILFLAPLAFNQTLEEASKVNRLEDSIYLWRDICQSKLLAKSNLILFLNKADVLKATLEAGVQVRRYVPSYGDLPNDAQTVTKYFKEKFKQDHRRFSPTTRPFMCHETSAVDVKSMEVLLIGVRESILRRHLREGDMI